MNAIAEWAAGFDRDGYAMIRGAVSREALARVAQLRPAGAGDRTQLRDPAVRALAGALREHPRVAHLLPRDARPVQCTLFAKSTERNWFVGPHRDLHIPVRRRLPDAALRGWSVKDGVVFVEAPAEVLTCMVAVRLHIDPCAAEDGPLRVWPGSHRGGPADGDGDTCPAAPGDALVLRPGLIHASSKAQGAGARRVLHFVFGPASLPSGLEWADQARPLTE